MHESNSENDPSLLRRLTGHRREVTGLSFHPDGKQLVSSSADSNLILWNLKKNAHAIKFENHSDQVTDVCFLPNAKAFASSSKDRTLRLWKPSINSRGKVITAHTSTVRSVHVSADSTNLLSASNDKNVKMWMTEYGNKFVSTFKGHTHWVNSARFSSDGKHVVSCSDDKTAKLWDRHTNCLVHTFEEKVVPNHVEFHPNNKCVGVAFANGHIKIYDIRNHKLLQFYCGNEHPVNKITFHPSGNFFISGSGDGLVNVYDIVEGRVIYTLEGHAGAVTALAFSPDGEHFATAGADKTVFVWNTNFHNCVARPLRRKSMNIDVRLNCMETEEPPVDVSRVQDSPTEGEKTFHDSKQVAFQENITFNNNIQQETNFDHTESFHSLSSVDSPCNAGGDASSKNDDQELNNIENRVASLKSVVKGLQDELGEIMKALEAVELRGKKF